MNHQVKISVIIPVYNTERHLGRCLDSVLGQSMQEIEVICIDDGSTDHSLDVLHQYANQDGRIQVITQSNQYAGIARNKGMQAACGKYLAFLDSDDIYTGDALSQLFSLAENNGLDFIKGRFYYLNDTNNFKYTTLYSENSSIDFLHLERLLSFRQLPLRLLQIADVPWNGLYRREFLEANNITFNSLRCVNDHSFYIHCLLKASRIMITRANIACYRVGQADSLIGQKAKHYSCHLASYDIVRQICQSLEQPLARSVLRQELNGLFGWYEQLLPLAPRPETLTEQLAAFLQSYDEQDVGTDYLRVFSYRDLYYRLRYGVAAPGRRPPFLMRALCCWQEHGLRYTFLHMMHKETRIKPCH